MRVTNFPHEPEWIDGVPWCRVTCKQHGGKPGVCKLLAPGMAVSTCLPAIQRTSDRVEFLEAHVRASRAYHAAVDQRAEPWRVEDALREYRAADAALKRFEEGI